MPDLTDPENVLKFPILIGDIGGTNARFALASPDGPGYERVLALQPYCGTFYTSNLAC